MSSFGLKLLILLQIAVDVIIVILFVFFIRKFRDFNKVKAWKSAVGAFESLLHDADRMAERFKEQLEEKQDLIKRFNEQMEKKILSLNVLLNRADSVLRGPAQTTESIENSVSRIGQQAQILALAKKGHDLESISQMLSMPKGEVKLVLDLKGKFSQKDRKEGVS